YVTELAGSSNSTIQQTITVTTPGTYELTLLHAKRADDPNNAGLDILVDGNVVATAPSPSQAGTPQEFSTSFELTTGTRTIGFAAADPSTDGKAALIDDVSLVAVGSATPTPPSNTPPFIIGSGIPDTNLTQGEQLNLNLPNFFSDAETPSADLVYTATDNSPELSIVNGALVGAPVTIGTQTISIRASDGDLSSEPSTFDLTVNAPPQSPPAGQMAYSASGTPWRIDPSDGLSLPATRYDYGGQGIAYNDLAGRQGGDVNYRPSSDVDTKGDENSGAIVWVDYGEWVEFTLDVETAGIYDLSLMGATRFEGESLNISFEQGGEVYTTANTSAPNTGSWSVFVPSSTAAVSLRAGVQVMRINMARVDIESWTLQPQPSIVDGPDPSPPSGQPGSGPEAPPAPPPPAPFTEVRDAPGEAVSYYYDALGRLQLTSYQSDSSINYAYDENGNRRSAA
ncbi:MAG: carbohydrate-binding protein, partial [Cyanobacteria bacterium J06555_12]